jgi:ubiquinone/menaquinone biosynthesis C-methylase UbiE
MSLYRDHVLPRVMNRVCASKQSAELRERACAPLTGHVIEVGFGSGLNVPHYPSTVISVDAVDPSDVAWRLASDRVSASHARVVRTGRDGASLPYDDASFDSALSTWTMCTIPDIEAALAELSRVLKPEALLCFVEHGLAPDLDVQAWQRRLQPFQKRMAGGCHLTRPVVELIVAAGFDITDVDVFYEPGAPKVVGAASLGVAVRR